MNSQNSKIMCSIVEHKSAGQLQNDVQPTPITRKLREMVTNVPTDEHGNKLPREMVKIVDNTKGRIMCLSEMVQKVDKPMPLAIDKLVLPVQKKQVIPSVDNKPSKPAFYSDESGFYYLYDMLYYEDTPFLNCKISIVDIVHSEDEDCYRCEILIKNQVIIKDIPISLYHNGMWVFDVIGVATIGERKAAKKLLYIYLDSLVHTLDLSKKIELLKKPGWQKVGENLVYVTPQGVIGNPDIRAYSKFGQNFANLIPKDSAFSRYLKMVNLTKSPAGAIIVLYLSLSLCSSLFRMAGFTPKFLLFVNGPRGSFKTSISLAASQLQYSDIPKYTLKATKAGLESAFKIYRDAVILVDDLAPTQEIRDRKIMQSNLETVVRSYGDGTGHRRCTVQYDSEGGAIITGEYTTGCESSLARCLFVPVSKTDVNLDLLSLLQNDKHIVEEFAVTFIFKLTVLMNDFDIIGFIETRGKKLRKDFGNRFSNERYSEYIAQLQTVADLLMIVGRKFGLLSECDIELYSKTFTNAILSIVNNNNKKLIQQTPINVVCTALQMALNDEKCLFCRLGNVVSDLDSVIFHDEEFYYISQKLCCQIVNEHIKENDINSPEFTSTRVADVLLNHNVISIVMEGKTPRKSIKLKYGSKRFMKINIAEFKKHINNTSAI